ncbi:hypothetical protein BOX15_Mlig014378g2 [Macrostomum lignano]|uniref:Store-operated calcium entry-associated regulatory factor n=1 Tax=Macrostomum lignano TaxID=282301 RepID=A0A267EVA2_9PLAT|nr:hypothetical protein BOX15_Mlig014378g2 [Macrostomum lignano]
MKSNLILLFLGLLFIYGECQQKVLLSSVQSITLHSEKFTTARRGSPIPQLRCIPTVIPCKSLPSTVQCYNKGTDGLDVQWKCEAQLPKSVQFDTIQVSCEGYDHPSDPYILAGSCGLTFSLKPTGIHHHKHSHHGHHHHHQHNAHYEVHTVRSSATVPIISGILLVVVLIGLVLLAYRICPCHPTHPTMLSDTPPTYYCRTQYKPLVDECSGGHNGPGFWTGAAIGGAAGYLVGSSGPTVADTTVVQTCVISSDDDSCDEDEVVTSAGYASTWRR